MDATNDLPIRRVGAALRFQRAGSAVGLSGAVDDGVGLGHPRSFLGEGAPSRPASWQRRSTSLNNQHAHY